MPGYCPKWRAVIQGWDESRSMPAVLPTRCKSWNCPYCAPINARKLAASLALAIDSLPVSFALFGTLTAGRYARSPTKSHREIQRAWPTVRQAIRRQYGPFEYLLIYERHRSGAYHAHLIILWLNTPEYPPMARKMTRLIKDNAGIWRIGRQAKILPIEGGAGGTIAYVTKAVRSYLGKGAASAAADLPRGARLYYASRGIPTIWRKGDGTWELRGRITDDEILDGVWSVADERELTLDDSDSQGYWPPLYPDEPT